MFDLELSVEQSAVIEVVRSFSSDHLRAVARRAEVERRVPPETAELAHSLGIFDAVTEAAGGDGIPDPVTLLMAVEELAAGDPALAFAICTSGLAARVVSQLGSADQTQDLLKPFVSGPAQGALGLYEGFGRRPRDLQTTATRTGGGWRIEGSKVAVSDPGSADVSVIIARRRDTDELAAFAVPGPLPGEVVRDDAGIGAISLLPARTASVVFDTTLPPDSVLDATGVEVARAVALARLTLAALAIGCGRAALAYASEYADERIAFGKPISEFQGVSFPLVDGGIANELARLETWRTAAQLGHLDDVAGLEAATDRSVSLASEAVIYATRTGVQIVGGHGFLTDHPVERWYRAGIALATIDSDPLDTPVRVSERVAQ